MIPAKFMETFLQKRRFNKVLEYITGKSVLDFGGNKGELQKFLPENTYYKCVNSIFDVDQRIYHNVVCLAVLEHIHYHKVLEIFEAFYCSLDNNGTVIITTPHIWAHPLLDIMSMIGLTDRANIKEHKFYWNKDSLKELAYKTGFEIMEYKKFQFGLNQLCVMRKVNR